MELKHSKKRAGTTILGLGGQTLDGEESEGLRWLQTSRRRFEEMVLSRIPERLPATVGRESRWVLATTLVRF
jgi:hypothetical protein